MTTPRWLHYTDCRGPFVLTEHRDGNAPRDASGLFVYSASERAAVEAGEGWPGRRCVEITAPDDVVELVQSFDGGELRGRCGERLPGFSEWFIPASAFGRCSVEED